MVVAGDGKARFLEQELHLQEVIMGRKGYVYGLVGRRVKIGKHVFYGYKSYSTKTEALKQAEEARESGRLARVIPQGTRFVLMVGVTSQKR
jgi:hypothetical protein